MNNEGTESTDQDKNGLYCLFNVERECGIDCMAFTNTPAESPALNEQQKNCVVIVGIERTGRFLGTLVKLYRDFLKDNRPAPPGPMGS